MRRLLQCTLFVIFASLLAIPTFAFAASKHIVRRPHHDPGSPQWTDGAFWRSDHGFDSYLRIKNVLLHSSLTVTPVVYMADGYEVYLRPITLEPAGVASINIRYALQNANDAATQHASAYGMAGVKYHWGWPAIMASIQNIDEIASITFHSSLDADAQALQDPAAPIADRTIQGLWWLPHAKADGYLALVNANKTPISAQIAFRDAQGHPLAGKTLPVAGHATALLSLAEILAAIHDPDATGSVAITYNGLAHSLLAYEGIEDTTVGYSASPKLMEIDIDPDMEPPSTGQVQLAAPGVMVGPPDPYMEFPAETVFTPYAYLYNTTDRPLNVDLLMAPIQGGPAVTLGTIALQPNGTAQPDIAVMMAQAKITPSKEYANLTFSYQGTAGDVDVETGSMDQTRNYVFEVAAAPEVTTISHTICYWTISGDNDTMITVWNYIAEPSDQVLTFYFEHGTYKLPLHLKPGEAKVLSVKAIQRDQIPDADGHVLPVNITEGSALLASSKGETEQMSVALSAASFNVRNGTCGSVCTTCNGVTEFSLVPVNLGLGIQQSAQMQGTETYNTGTVQNTTTGAWSSNAQSIATVGGAGMTTGISPGQAGIQFLINNVPVGAGNICAGTNPVCPVAFQMGAEAPVSVNLPDHVSVAVDQEGYPAACPKTGIYVRQIKAKLVDKNNSTVSQTYSVAEQYQNLSNNSCGNGSPVASSCTATDAGDVFLDTLSVSSNFCSSGIAQSSGCGYSQTSVWSVCSGGQSNSIWNSPRVTHSNSVSVNGQTSTFSVGTQLH